MSIILSRYSEENVLIGLGSNLFQCIADCLDLEGGTIGDGGKWGWNGGNNQRWLIQPDVQGYLSILSVASGRAIDVAGESTENGANILQWSYNGGDNQKRRLVR